jgi:threonine/homoserine/homoserine lactone efflux protein
VIAFLGAGVVLGLSAGFSPGPLLALVLAHTLRHGTKEGVKVAVAPLLTDLPIILLSLFTLTRFAQYPVVFGAVSLVGGLFVLHLAGESLRTRGLAVALPAAEPQSLRTGTLVNLLSPHPWLFWLTVGAPTTLRAWAEGPSAALLFVAGFMGCLVGAKLFLAVLAGRSRHLLNDRTYGLIMRLLGLMLLVFAFLMMRDGVRLLRASAG